MAVDGSRNDVEIIPKSLYQRYLEVCTLIFCGYGCFMQVKLFSSILICAELLIYQGGGHAIMTRLEETQSLLPQLLKYCHKLY